MDQSRQILEWQAQAYAKGEAKGKADAILLFAARHLGQPVPADLAATIRATTDLTKLDQWLEAAINLTTLDDLRRLVQG